MRVKVEHYAEGEKLGTFLGLLPPNGCDRCGIDMPMAVVKLDEGKGLFLHEAHPATVHPVIEANDRDALRERAREIVADLGLDADHAAFVNVVYRGLVRVALAPGNATKEGEGVLPSA